MESVSSLAREAIFRPGLIQRVDAGSSKSTVMTGMPCLFLVAVIGGDWRWKISIGKLENLLTDFQSSIGFDSRVCVIQVKELADCDRFNDFLEFLNQTPQMNDKRI